MNYRCETDLASIKEYLQNAAVVAFDFETAPLLQYRDDPRAALDAHRACIVRYQSGRYCRDGLLRRRHSGGRIPDAL